MKIYIYMIMILLTIRLKIWNYSYTDTSTNKGVATNVKSQNLCLEPNLHNLIIDCMFYWRTFGSLDWSHCFIYLLLLLCIFTFADLRVLVDRVAKVTDTQVVVVIVKCTTVGLTALGRVDTSFSYCWSVEQNTVCRNVHISTQASILTH